MLKKITLLIFALSTISSGIHTSNAYSKEYISAPENLKTLIDATLENNRNLKALNSTKESLDEKAESVSSLPDPKAGIALNNLPVDSFAFDKEPMTQKQIFISQTIPWLSKLEYKSEIISGESKTLLAIIDKVKTQLAVKMADLYYDLLFTDEEIKTNLKLQNMLVQTIRFLNSRYRSGKISQQDIFRAEIELEKLRDKEKALNKKHLIIENRINELLNRSSFKKIETRNDLEPKFLKLNFHDIKNKALLKNPDILIAKTMVEKEASNVNLAKNEFYPDFSIKAAYGQRDNNLTDFASVSFSISLPFFNRKSHEKYLGFASKKKESAKTKLDRIKIELPMQIKTKIDRMEELSERYELYEKSIIPTSKRLAEASSNDYKVGKTDFEIMIKTRIETIKNELELKNFLKDYKKTMAELEGLAGSPLNLGIVK